MKTENNEQKQGTGPLSEPPCSGGFYQMVNDAGERWIGKPDNGGDLGDMQDIVAELNRLLNLLQRTHYNLIGRHGWGDPDAVFIGETMGWDSGSPNTQGQARVPEKKL